MKQSTKNLLLVAGFMMAIIVAYQYSFSKTIETRDRLEALKSQIANNSQTSINRMNLEAKEIYLDSIINKNRAGNSSLQNNLLKVLNHYSEKYSYKIISFEEPHVQVFQDSSDITSFQFTLEGEYINLEKLLYELESDYSFGALSHINFEKKKDYRNNSNYLQCMVLVQHVR